MAVSHDLHPCSGAVRWVLGVTNATRYPTNGFGGGTATNTSSILSGASGVEIVGYIVNVAAAVAISVVDHDGTDIPGTSITLAAGTLGFIPLGIHYKATGTGGSNIGIKCTNTATATLLYRA